ncbi:MAG: S8 family serine peptidase, partial [Myxococcota bacterium]
MVKLHSVADRYIVQLPKDVSLKDCGVESGPGQLSTSDKGRYVLNDLSDSQQEAIAKAGGQVFENRPMSIPEPITARKLEDRVSGITRQTVNTRATHGADQLHARGIRGTGTDLVVIDSGMAPHPDYEDRVEGFFDVFANAEVAPVDGRTGHGTHVAGIGGADGTVRGMAPGAALLGIRVLDDSGRGSTASVLSGLDQALKYFQERGRPMVVNMSLGGPAGPVESDPLHAKISELKEAGILVVAAAGNSGPRPGTISSPSNSEDAISVAAYDTKGTPQQDDDTVAPFSSRGTNSNDGTGQQ